jgi:hypothetical protein
MMESVLCLDKSYKSFHHGHDATFPKACRCRVKVHWLGEVMLHTRPSATTTTPTTPGMTMTTTTKTQT